MAEKGGVGEAGGEAAEEEQGGPPAVVLPEVERSIGERAAVRHHPLSLHFHICGPSEEASLCVGIVVRVVGVLTACWSAGCDCAWVGLGDSAPTGAWASNGVGEATLELDGCAFLTAKSDSIRISSLAGL